MPTKASPQKAQKKANLPTGIVEAPQPRSTPQVTQQVVQRKAAGAKNGNVLDGISIDAPRRGEVRKEAQKGIRTQASAYPHAERIQASFGAHDVSGIKAHLGSDAATSANALAAEAYTFGNHAVFRGSPSLFDAAHEAAHAVQQRSGAVNLSNLFGEMGAVGDRWEQNADAVAQRVVAGRSAADLLPAPSGAQAMSFENAAQLEPAGVQRLVWYNDRPLKAEEFRKWLGKDYLSPHDMEVFGLVSTLISDPSTDIEAKSLQSLYDRAERLLKTVPSGPSQQDDNQQLNLPMNLNLNNKIKNNNYQQNIQNQAPSLEKKDKEDVTQNLPKNANWLDLKKQATEAYSPFKLIVETLRDYTTAINEEYDTTKHLDPKEIKTYNDNLKSNVEKEIEPAFDKKVELNTNKPDIKIEHKPKHYKTKTVNFSSVAPLKEVLRSRVKAYVKYGKADGRRDYSRILDVVRGTLSFEAMSDMVKAMKITFAMQEKLGYEVVRCKQTYEPKDPTFYGDVKMNLREAKTGHVCELQFTTREFVKAKPDGHVPYNTLRKLNPLGKERDELFETLEPKQKIEYDLAIESSQRAYRNARRLVDTDPNYKRAIATAKWIQSLIDKKNKSS